MLKNVKMLKRLKKWESIGRYHRSGSSEIKGRNFDCFSICPYLQLLSIYQPTNSEFQLQKNKNSVSTFQSESLSIYG
jgi:hypothetical protein